MFEILGTKKGVRPDASTYLSGDYINAHLSMFDDGCVYFLSETTYELYYKNANYIARKDGTLFVMPQTYFDNVIKNSNGNIAYIEKALGYTKGSLLPGNYIAIKIKKSNDIELYIPSGNEDGANSLWIPGGYTSGGIPEAIASDVPNNDKYVEIIEFAF